MDASLLSRFIKGTIHISLGTAISITAGFLSLMVAVRFVPKDQFGTYVLLEVISAFFVMICDFGQNPSITRFILGADQEKKKELINTAIFSRLILTVILGALILILKPVLLTIFRSDLLPKLIVFLPIFFFITSFHELLHSIMQGLHLYKTMLVAQIAKGAARFSLILIFLVILKMNIYGLIYAYILSHIFVICIQYLLLPVKLDFIVKIDLVKKIFNFGYPLGLNNILSFLFLKVDTLMIGALVSTLGVSYYEIASKIPNSCRQMYQSFRTVYFPSMSELFLHNKKEEAEKLLDNSVRLVSFATIFAALIIALFQNDIILVFFTTEYLNSAPALTILMISLNMALIGNIMGTSLVAAGFADKPFKINIFMTIANILGNLIMIPLFGFMGAVYATLVSNYFTNAIISVWYLKKSNININVSEFFKPIILFACILIIFFSLNLKNIVLKISLILLFLLTCIFFSVITKKDLLILQKGISFHPTTESQL